MLVLDTDTAPKAIGPYSQAIEVGGFLFTSGQIPMDPQTSDIVGETIQEQTERVMENLKNLLKANGIDFSHVVKTTCFLTNMEDFPKFNSVYEKYFTKHKPARSTVSVCELPKKVLVEVEIIAVKNR
ncbi:MAG: RidA family protein [Bacillus sp. (in: firmicutes)]